MKNAIKLLTRASLLLAGLALLQSCGGGGDDGGFEPLIIASDADAGAAQRPQVTLTIASSGGVSGTVVITLLPEHAPLTVANFLAYVNTNFYLGSIIHRHQANFVMQGGGYA